MPTPLKRDSAAFVGVGYTPLPRTPDRSEVGLGVEACRMAAEDAGLEPSEIDGICIQVHHYPPPETAAIAKGLGMKEVRWQQDGGPMGMPGAGMATRLLESGQCKAVVICKILNTIAPLNTPQIDPDTGLVAGPTQFEVPFGLSYTFQKVGMYCRRYMHRYRITERQSGWVAVVERDYAVEHPFAYQKAPITMDDYLSSRWIAEPVRLLDCDLPVNGAFAYLMTKGDMARGLRHPPVWPVGWADMPDLANAEDHLLPLPGEKMSPVAAALYKDTGLSPKDIDVAYMYDGFTFFVPIWLENVGIFKRGDAGDFIDGGERIRRTGELPINTHGGNLSSGRMHGQGHLLEAIEQLRRSAGPRQITKPMKYAIVTNALPFTGSVGIMAAD